MDKHQEESIRRRAHQIWEDEGRPEGKEAEHWDRAAREVAGKKTDSSAHGDAVKAAAEGSKTERVADDLQSGKAGRRG